MYTQIVHFLRSLSMINTGQTMAGLLLGIVNQQISAQVRSIGSPMAPFW